MLRDMITLGYAILPRHARLVQSIMETELSHDQKTDFLTLFESMQTLKPNELLDSVISKLMGNPDAWTQKAASLMPLSAEATSIDTSKLGKLSASALYVHFYSILRGAHTISAERFPVDVLHLLESYSNCSNQSSINILQSIALHIVRNRSSEFEPHQLVQICSTIILLRRQYKISFSNEIDEECQHVFLTETIKNEKYFSSWDVSVVCTAFVCHAFCDALLQSPPCTILQGLLESIAMQEAEKRVLSITRIGYLEIVAHQLYMVKQVDSSVLSKVSAIIIDMLRRRVDECSVDFCVRALLLCTRVRATPSEVSNQFLDELIKKSKANEVIHKIVPTQWVKLAFILWKLQTSYHADFVADRIARGLQEGSVNLIDAHKSVVYLHKIKVSSYRLNQCILQRITLLPPQIPWTECIASCRCLQALYALPRERNTSLFGRAAQRTLLLLEPKLSVSSNCILSAEDLLSVLFIFSLQSKNDQIIYPLLKAFIGQIEKWLCDDTESGIIVEIVYLLQKYTDVHCRKIYALHTDNIRKLLLKALRISQSGTTNDLVRTIASVAKIGLPDKIIEDELQAIFRCIPRRLSESSITDRSIGVFLALLARNFPRSQTSLFKTLLLHAENECPPTTIKTAISMLVACAEKEIHPGKALADHIMFIIASRTMALRASDMTAICRAFWQLNIRMPVETLRALQKAVEPRCTTMHIQTCSIILRTLCVLPENNESERFFGVFYKAIALALDRDPSVRLSNLIRILSSITSRSRRSLPLEEKILKFISKDAAIRDISSLGGEWVQELRLSLKKMNIQNRFPEPAKVINSVSGVNEKCK